MDRASRRPIFRAAAAFALLGVSAVGCVNQQQYDNLYSTNRTLEERNVALRQELDSAENTIAMLRQRMGEANTNITDLRDQNAALRGDVTRLRGDYGDLVDRLNTVSLAVLDPATDRALRELADQNPGLITYDSNRGVLRFASDLTFGSGSDVVTEAAAASLTKLASVLSGVAVGYNLRIVGHTDNVPVSRPETVQRHRTNMHLSAHRAISVFNSLQRGGVPTQRMEIAGRGEHLPAVPNRSGGTAENRRVEIFLVPAQDTSAAGSTAPTSTPTQPASGTSRPDPMK